MSSAPVLEEFVIWDRMSEKVRKEWEQCQVPYPDNCEELGMVGTCDDLTAEVNITVNVTTNSSDIPIRRLLADLDLYSGTTDIPDGDDGSNGIGDDSTADASVDSGDIDCCVDNPPNVCTSEAIAACEQDPTECCEDNPPDFCNDLEVVCGDPTLCCATVPPDWCSQTLIDACDPANFAPGVLSSLTLCHPSQFHLGCGEGMIFHWDQPDNLPTSRAEITDFLKLYYYNLSLSTNFTLEDGSMLRPNSELEDFQWWIIEASHSGYYTCEEILYPNTKRCCAGYYCEEGEPCMRPCTIQGAWCNNCSFGSDYEKYIGCTGAATETKACPRRYFCPNPSEREICPKGSYCIGGVTSPKQCRFFESCEEEGLELPNNDVLSVFLFVLLVIFLGIIFARKWFKSVLVAPLGKENDSALAMEELLQQTQEVQHIRVYFNKNQQSSVTLEGMDFELSVDKSKPQKGMKMSTDFNARGRDNQSMVLVTEITGPDGTRYKVYGEQKSSRAALLKKANTRAKLASDQFNELSSTGGKGTTLMHGGGGYTPAVLPQDPFTPQPDGMILGGRSDADFEIDQRRTSEFAAGLQSDAHLGIGMASTGTGFGGHANGKSSLASVDENEQFPEVDVNPFKARAAAAIRKASKKPSIPTTKESIPEGEEITEGDTFLEVSEFDRSQEIVPPPASSASPGPAVTRPPAQLKSTITPLTLNVGEMKKPPVTGQVSDDVMGALDAPQSPISQSHTLLDSQNNNQEMYNQREMANMLKNKLKSAIDELDTDDEEESTIKRQKSVAVPDDGQATAQERPLFLCDMEYTDLSLNIKGSGISVLEPCSGILPAGTVTAVMGASGAGKTSFMFALCGKAASYGDIGGEVTVNGEPMDGLAFRDCMGFVPQGDVMDPNLTVWECLWYEGRLRLPADMPDEEVSSIVARTIRDVGLAHVAHSRIGDAEERGLSGGQKKRVNIAMELVAEPSMLFLDEPTSGLDATTATEIMNTLRYFADHRGTMIVVVLHQPRFEIFMQFDSLILLAKGGRQVYAGPTVQCLPFICKQVEIVNKIRTQDQFGKQPEVPDRPMPNTNPADYLMDCISECGLELSSRWKALSEAASADDEFIASKPFADKSQTGGRTASSVDTMQRIAMCEEMANVTEDDMMNFLTLVNTQSMRRLKTMKMSRKFTRDYEPRDRLNFFLQFVLLSHRVFKIRYVHRIAEVLTELMACCAASFALGGTGLRVRFGTIPTQAYLLCLTVSILPVTVAVKDYAMERLVYYRMASTQAVNRVAYWLSKWLVLFLFHGTIFPMGFLIVHFCIAQPQSWFWNTWPITVALWAALTAMAHLISVSTLPQNGLVIGGAICVIFNITSGFAPTLASLKKSILGLAYTSINPNRYALEAIWILESAEWTSVWDKRKDELADQYGWNENNYGNDFLALVIIAIVFQLFTLNALYVVNSDKQI